MKEGEEEIYNKFWRQHYYVRGSYDKEQDFVQLNKELNSYEPEKASNRVFYLALPPTVFESVTKNLRRTCMAEKLVNV